MVQICKTRQPSGSPHKIKEAPCATLKKSCIYFFTKIIWEFEWVNYGQWVYSTTLNSFHATGLFIYPLKTSGKKNWFSDVFGVWIETSSMEVKFFINDIFSKCDLMWTFGICSYWLQKSLIENLISSMVFISYDTITVRNNEKLYRFSLKSFKTNFRVAWL